ncbi:putative adhesin MafB domain protein [Neisseria meningitidis NM27]|nr:putative adhesin MafB domain protein [Neisseria meningitidis NM27]
MRLRPQVVLPDLNFLNCEYPVKFSVLPHRLPGLPHCL